MFENLKHFNISQHQSVSLSRKSDLSRSNKLCAWTAFLGRQPNLSLCPQASVETAGLQNKTGKQHQLWFWWGSIPSPNIRGKSATSGCSSRGKLSAAEATHGADMHEISGQSWIPVDSCLHMTACKLHSLVFALVTVAFCFELERWGKKVCLKDWPKGTQRQNPQVPTVDLLAGCKCQSLTNPRYLFSNGLRPNPVFVYDQLLVMYVYSCQYIPFNYIILSLHLCSWIICV